MVQAAVYIKKKLKEDGILANAFQKVKVCSSPLLNFIDQPFPKQQILDSSKLREFLDNNFKCDENGRKFSKQVQKTVGKGEIACFQQFLLFPQCFQKSCAADT